MDKIAAEAAAKSAKELAKMLEGWERIDLIDYRLLLPFFQSALSQSLAEREHRIAELEAALRECIYAVLHGDGTVPPSARAALAATEESKP